MESGYTRKNVIAFIVEVLSDEATLKEATLKEATPMDFDRGRKLTNLADIQPAQRHRDPQFRNVGVVYEGESIEQVLNEDLQSIGVNQQRTYIVFDGPTFYAAEGPRASLKPRVVERG